MVLKKNFVLRTCFDTYSIWKARYSKDGSPFNALIKGTSKESAIVDNEVWVFNVDAEVSNDIFTAVKIGMDYFKVSAEDIIRDVYVKNLNAENEGELNHGLVQANQQPARPCLHKFNRSSVEILSRSNRISEAGI